MSMLLERPGTFGQSPEDAVSRHESLVMQFVHGVGHVASELASVIVFRHSPEAGEAAANVSTERLHDTNPYTMQTPDSWGHTHR
jgi:hypothetical protein